MSSIDICTNKDDPTAGCPKDLPKDPKNTCEQIKNEYDALIEQAKAYRDSVKSFSLSECLKSLGANNKISAAMKNVINNVQQASQTTINDQKCENIVNNLQQNIITTTDDCLKAQTSVITILQNNPEALSKYIESTGVKNVIQENKTEVKQQCVLQNYVAAALKLDASVESAALLKMMQSSSDLFASNDADTDICNNVNNTMTSCQYIKSNLCCVNHMNSTQQNLIECRGATDLTQENTNTAFQICNLTGSTTVDAGLIAKLKSSVSASISQTATGTSLMSFVLLLAVIILGPPLGIGLFSFFLPKEIVVAFFGILCIIIGIVILSMYKPLPSIVEFINKTRDKPIFSAKDYKPNNSYKPTAQSDIKPIKYSAAKKICLDDKSCLAMDFSITKIENNKDISEDSLGVPVYYNSIKDGYCEEDIDDNKNTYFTNYKPQQPAPLNLYGALLISLGAILILMAMYLLFTPNSTSKSNSKLN